MKNKVLVLGSSGLVGHQVYNYLKANSDFVLSNISNKRKIDEKTFLIDARNEVSFFNQIRKIRPNYIVNCIGVLISESENNHGKAAFLNAYLPHRLVYLANEINSKLIHMSTDSVFSGNKKSPYLETDERDGEGVYAKTKVLGEVFSENHLTIRTSVVGPEIINGSESLFHWFMNQTNNIKGYTKAIWSGVTTIEIAKAVKWSIDNEITGLYHITNNHSISKNNLLQLFKKYTHKDIEIIPIDGNETNKSFIDTRKLIDYEIPSYKQMISDLVQLIANNRALYSHYKIKEDLD